MAARGCIIGAKNLVSYGYVVGLDYANPWLSPFDEMQRLKTHPHMRSHLRGRPSRSYGARALSEGGFQSLPKLTFPGGCLVGDTAGFLNVPKIKGTHTAMKSGMLAAEAVAEALAAAAPPSPPPTPKGCARAGCGTRLRAVRNIRPGFAKFGLCGGMLNAAVDTYVFRGQAPWTLQHRTPTTRRWPRPMRPADRLPQARRRADLRPAVLGVHQQHQPRGGPAGPPRLRDPGRWRSASTGRSTAARRPATAPPGSTRSSAPKTATRSLQINAQNCVHCKTCDIKDPTQNIDWEPPEGGGGPVYPSGM